MKWCKKMVKLRLLTMVLVPFLLLGGCASDDAADENLTAEQLYNKAHDYLDRTSYKKAAETFEKVELEYPYSRWATDSKLMGAYAYYKNKDYDSAVISLDRFIRFHPGNRNVAYAYYLKAICFYDQISDVNREQGKTKEALDTLSQLSMRFPGTPYAEDARQKIVFAREHLAGKQMEVGRYYLNLDNYLSALNRFSEVVDDYGDTGYAEEALYRQVEIYTIVGLNNEAVRVGTLLQQNYPNGAWTAKAQNILNRN